MKRTIVLLLATLVFVSLTACGSKNEASQANNQASQNAVTEIEFDHTIGGDTIDKLVEEYNKTQNKVRVKPVFVSAYYDELMEKLQAKAVANELPDLFTNGYNYTQFAIDNFPVVPLQTFIDQEKFDTSDFFPNMLDLAKGTDGKIYGLPFALSTPIIYINDDLFKAAGLNPKNAPKTWDEVREVAKTLTKGNQYGVFFDYPNSVANWFFTAMLQSAGGTLMKDANHVGFNSLEGRSAVQLLHDLQSVDKTMPNLDGKQAEQSFLTGKIAMFVTSSGRAEKYSNNGNFLVSTAVFPTAGNKPRKLPAGGNSLFIIAKDKKKQEAAWDFIKFATSPRGNSLFAQKTGYMVVRQSTLTTQDLMGDYLQKVPNAKASYSQAQDVVPWVSFPGTNGPKMDEILRNNIIAAVQGTKTVEQALGDAESQTNALLKK